MIAGQEKVGIAGGYLLPRSLPWYQSINPPATMMMLR
jgi:hypothetical protein